MALYKSLLSNRLAIKFFFSHAAADPHRPFLLPGLTIRRPFPAVRAKDGVSGEQGHAGGFKLEVEQLRAAPEWRPQRGSRGRRKPEQRREEVERGSPGRRRPERRRDEAERRSRGQQRPDRRREEAERRSPGRQRPCRRREEAERGRTAGDCVPALLGEESEGEGEIAMMIARGGG